LIAYGVWSRIRRQYIKVIVIVLFSQTVIPIIPYFQPVQLAEAQQLDPDTVRDGGTFFEFLHGHILYIVEKDGTLLVTDTIKGNTMRIGMSELESRTWLNVIGVGSGGGQLGEFVATFDFVGGDNTTQMLFREAAEGGMKLRLTGNLADGTSFNFDFDDNAVIRGNRTTSGNIVFDFEDLFISGFAVTIDVPNRIISVPRGANFDLDPRIALTNNDWETGDSTGWTAASGVDCSQSTSSTDPINGTYSRRVNIQSGADDNCSTSQEYGVENEIWIQFQMRLDSTSGADEGEEKEIMHIQRGGSHRAGIRLEFNSTRGTMEFIGLYQTDTGQVKIENGTMYDVQLATIYCISLHYLRSPTADLGEFDVYVNGSLTFTASAFDNNGQTPPNTVGSGQRSDRGDLMDIVFRTDDWYVDSGARVNTCPEGLSAPASASALTVNVYKFDESTLLTTQSPTVRVETINGTATSFVACASQCGFLVEATDTIRISVRHGGGGVKVNGTDTVNYSVTADVTISVIAGVYTGAVLHFMYNDGNLQDPTNITMTMDVNSSDVTITTGFSSGTLALGDVGGGNGSNSIGYIYEFNENRVPNATATWNVTANDQVFSFRITVYAVNLQGRTPNGLANTYVQWTVNMTLTNQSTVFEVQSDTDGLIDLNYIGNGTATCVAWWRNLIVNSSFTCSFSDDGTTNMLVQVEQDVDSTFRVGRHQTTIQSFNFSSADGVLRFNITAVSGVQTLLIIHLDPAWAATPEDRLLNDTRETLPGSLLGTIFTDTFSAGTTGPTLVSYSYSSTVQASGGGGGGGGGGVIFNIVAALPRVLGFVDDEGMPDRIPFIASGTLLIVLVLGVIVAFFLTVRRGDKSISRKRSATRKSGGRSQK